MNNPSVQQSKQSKGGVVRGHAQRILASQTYLSKPNLCRHCSQQIQIMDGVPISHTRRKQFCNMSCSSKFNNSRKPKRQRTLPRCFMCDRKLKPYSRENTCATCVPRPDRPLTPRLRTKQQLFASRSGYQSARGYIQRHAVLVYKRSGRPMECQCGYRHHVDIAHITPVAAFHQETTIETINSISNLTALCPNCHWEYDNGLLKLVAQPGFEPGSGAYETPEVTVSLPR